MQMILMAAALVLYAAFWGRLGWHVLLWLGAARPSLPSPVPLSPLSPAIFGALVLDVLFLRRLFESSKALWLGSWLFHASLFLVLLRHLRFAMAPVPACVAFIQPAGLVAGYVLPASLLYLMTLRTLWRKERYTSYGNYLVIGLLFSLGATGLLMRLAALSDVVGAKRFILGLSTFTPVPVPGEPVFILHFVLFLVLVPLLPFHLFAVPLVTVQARRREEALGGILHERETA